MNCVDSRKGNNGNVAFENSYRIVSWAANEWQRQQTDHMKQPKILGLTSAVEQINTCLHFGLFVLHSLQWNDLGHLCMHMLPWRSALTLQLVLFHLPRWPPHYFYHYELSSKSTQSISYWEKHSGDPRGAGNGELPDRLGKFIKHHHFPKPTTYFWSLFASPLQNSDLLRLPLATLKSSLSLPAPKHAEFSIHHRDRHRS